MHTFQEIVAILSNFWAKHGCIIATPYDLEKGAGTSNPTTFLRALGPEPYNAAYIEPCRRPKDGRYGENPNRLQHYFQYQVILKPSPDNILELYLESLKAIGMKIEEHDIRFVHDDWENPTLGAWGLGWEVWIDGMEMTQFTYFQAVAGIPLHPITGEITYGIERIAMCLQGVNSIFDIKWNDTLTYGDIYKQNEVQWSHYNFEAQDEAMWARHFADFQNEAKRLVEKELPIPAYDFVVKSSHAFNMLDAKGVISVTERAHYIASIRDLAKRAADGYLTFREKMGFPLLKKMPLPVESAHSSTAFEPRNKSSSKETFILEIGVEELPATFVPIGIRELERIFKDLLSKHSLSYTSCEVYGTPRRLAVVIRDLDTKTQEETEERRGPPVSSIWDTSGTILPAGKGFFTSIGLTEATQYPQSIQDVTDGKIKGLSVRELKGAQYLFFNHEKKAQSTSEILYRELPSLIQKIEFPKSMKWGSYTSITFARPIRWLLSLFGNETIPFQLHHLTASNSTRGNRQLTGSQLITITHADEYEKVLEEKGNVIVNQKRRAQEIEAQLSSIEEKHSLKAIDVQKVLKQVIYLVEKPFLGLLSFDPAFLQAPKEVLTSEMIEHQKYFPVENAQTGKLAPSFVIVANRPVSQSIEDGNKKVLSARLADGTFLWHEDQKTSLQEMREKLKTVTYQTGAGSVYQKTERMRALSEMLAQTFGSDQNKALIKEISLAASLSKADLTSLLVGEFPELQGTIGRHLAESQKLSQHVAQAIEEHWLPNQEGGKLPSYIVGSIVSLADKLDTLSVFFTLGMKPTSSSDPFALRRAALGIVRILIEQKLSGSLEALIDHALELPMKEISKAQSIKRDSLRQEIASFIITRAKAYLCDRGFEKECVETVLSESNTSIRSVDLYDAFCRLEALSKLKRSPEQMKSFVEVLKRCIGQLDNPSIKPLQDGSKLKERSEIALYKAIEEITHSFGESEKLKSWDQALSHLLQLQKPIDDLFNEVKVLSTIQEEKERRLSLLQSALTLINRFGDMKRFCGFK